MEIPFAISARTAKLIGMENFANAEGAIVELVKNAYDADADSCIIVADIHETRNGSRLYIIDNGSGMTAETIALHWMTIGTDDKLVNTKTYNKQRIKSGAKGIGRFALNRLGRKVEMFTFTESTGHNGYLWSVDWSMFEKARILSDIKATLKECSYEEAIHKLKSYGLGKLPIFNKLNHADFKGTILCISELNDTWSDDNLNSLLKNLELLIPEHMQTMFGIYLYNLNDLEWGGEVIPAEYADYDYKVTAKYDGEETIHISIVRNELNVSLLETKYAKVFARPAMQKKPYRLEDFRQSKTQKSLAISKKVDPTLLSQVGVFSFTFFFIKNTIKDDSDRDGNKKYPYNPIDSLARKRWLEKFGGVRIFRDDFRVRPYGENGNDWLDLGRRQAQSPAGVGQKIGGYRIRPNQIAGIVSISRLTNPEFEDKSSREGIQENDAFTVFKNLLIQIIAEFEYDRNYIMYNLAEQYKEDHPITIKAQDIAKQALNQKSEEGQTEDKKKLKILAESYHSLEEELKDKEAELSMLRSLASMGISVATYTHELLSVMKRLLPRNNLLRNILTKYLPEDQFANMRFNNPYKELEAMRGEDEKLYNWLSYSLQSIQRSKRDRCEINMADYFTRFAKSWEPSLFRKNIKIHLHLSNIDHVTIDAYEMDLDSVYNNFISNSINAFMKSAVDEKEINIYAKDDHGYLVVDFVDNGSGLSLEYKDNPDVIFNAFETSTVDNKNNKIGTGMGLFIAKGIIEKFTDSMITLIPREIGFCIRTIIKLKKDND